MNSPKLYDGKDCSCPKTGCDFHGKCRECRELHGKSGGKTWCEKEAATPKRSGWSKFLNVLSVIFCPS
jgi:hypothetical protein